MSGPKIITAKPSVAPIAHGAHSWRARGFIATAQIASTSRKAPSASTTPPAKLPPRRLETSAFP